MKFPTTIFPTLSALRDAFRKGKSGAFMGNIPAGSIDDILRVDDKKREQGKSQPNELAELKPKLTAMQRDKESQGKDINSLKAQVKELKTMLQAAMLHGFCTAGEVNNLVAGRRATKIEIPTRQELTKMMKGFNTSWGQTMQK